MNYMSKAINFKVNDKLPKMNSTNYPKAINFLSVS